MVPCARHICIVIKIKRIKYKCKKSTNKNTIVIVSNKQNSAHTRIKLVRKLKIYRRPNNQQLTQNPTRRKMWSWLLWWTSSADLAICWLSFPSIELPFTGLIWVFLHKLWSFGYQQNLSSMGQDLQITKLYIKVHKCVHLWILAYFDWYWVRWISQFYYFTLVNKLNLL